MKAKNKIITAVLLSAGAAVGTALINKYIKMSAVSRNLLAQPEPRCYRWRLGNIYYTKKGTGSPILLIHDALPGASGYEWSKIEDELAIDHTVYTVDLLGCGRSDKSSITYTNFVYVQMISDFIKKIIGQKTDVIASGFSGSFVTMACHNEKELFNKIMLVNPPSLTQLKQMPNRKDRLLKAALEIPIFGTLVYHMIVSRDNINNLFIEKMYYNPFHVDNQMADAYYEAAHKGGYYTRFLYSSLAAKYININICHALKALDNSIYIVEGETEPNGKAVTDDYCASNPAIEVSVLKETKHLPHVEAPEAFLEQVKIFF